MAGLDIARRGLQEIKALLESLTDDRRRTARVQRAAISSASGMPPTRRQIPRDGGWISLRISAGLTGAFAEELHRRIRARLGLGFWGRAGEPVQLDDPLSPQAQAPAGGDNEANLRGGVENRCHDGYRRAEAIEVVQDEKQPTVAQLLDERLNGIAVCRGGKTEGIHGGAHHEGGGVLLVAGAQPGQRHGVHFVALRLGLATDRYGQPSFTNTSRTHNRHQPTRWVVKQRGHMTKLTLSTDERPRRHG